MVKSPAMDKKPTLAAELSAEFIGTLILILFGNGVESSATNVGFLSMAGDFTIARRQNVISYRFHVQGPFSSRSFGWAVVDSLGPDTMGRGRARGATHRHLSGLRSGSVQVVHSDDAARGGRCAGCDRGAVLLAD